MAHTHIHTYTYYTYFYIYIYTISGLIAYKCCVNGYKSHLPNSIKYPKLAAKMNRDSLPNPERSTWTNAVDSNVPI